MANITKEYYPIPTKDGGTAVIFIKNISHILSVVGDKTCVIYFVGGEKIEVLNGYNDFIRQITAP